jgi:hypothetical protein
VWSGLTWHRVGFFGGLFCGGWWTFGIWRHIVVVVVVVIYWCLPVTVSLLLASIFKKGNELVLYNRDVLRYVTKTMKLLTKGS